MNMTEEELKYWSDPAVSLLAYGTIAGQERVGSLLRFDPNEITYELQNTIVSYVSSPPIDQMGYTRWLSLLGYRQGGKSAAGALSFYPKVAYNPAWEHVTIADTKRRADGLHKRVMLNHHHWPEEYRTEQRVKDAFRVLDLVNGSTMRTESAHAEVVGIGQSIASVLASEIAFWRDAGEQFMFMNPAMINRKDCLMLKECTPAPMSHSSAQFWMDECVAAKKGKGRSIYAFFPFWDGKLNARPWEKGTSLDVEELRLLEQYGHLGLKLENLAFRRYVFETDQEIRRNYDLFHVFYPFDDISCWISSGSGTIPEHALKRHKTSGLQKEPEGELVVFREPCASAIYLITADPAGYGADHHAFHVWEMWDDEWEQVASFAGNVDPEVFARHIFDAGMKYNQARIAVEGNGPGVACAALLRHMKYPNIYHNKHGKPYVSKCNHEEWMSHLVDALLDKFTLNGEDTVTQLRSYRSDKMVERKIQSVIMSPTDKTTRRDRHHWDRVSAMMVCAVVGRTFPKRSKPNADQEKKVILFQDMTWEDHQRYQRQLAAHKAKGQRHRARYTSRRKKRR